MFNYLFSWFEVKKPVYKYAFDKIEWNINVVFFYAFKKTLNIFAVKTIKENILRFDTIKIIADKLSAHHTVSWNYQW